MCVCICTCSVRSESLNPKDCSMPGSSVHGISQARIWEWIVIFCFRGSSWPKDWTHVSCISCIGKHCATWEAPNPRVSEWKSLSHVWLCDPKDYTVHGILQARILEWVAFPCSRGSYQPRDQTQVSALQVDSLPAESQGKPISAQAHSKQLKWANLVITTL